MKVRSELFGLRQGSGLQFLRAKMLFCVFFLEFFGHPAVFNYECTVIPAVPAFPDRPQLR